MYSSSISFGLEPRPKPMEFYGIKLGSWSSSTGLKFCQGYSTLVLFMHYNLELDILANINNNCFTDVDKLKLGAFVRTVISNEVCQSAHNSTHMT